MSDPKKPETKIPEPEIIPGQGAPPAGGSVGPPPSQSPFEPAPEEKAPKDDKAHKNDEKAHKNDEKAHVAHKSEK